MSDGRTRILASECNDYLPKPFRVGEVLRPCPDPVNLATNLNSAVVLAQVIWGSEARSHYDHNAAVILATRPST